MGNVASETTFDHWKVVFLMSKSEKKWEKGAWDNETYPTQFYRWTRSQNRCQIEFSSRNDREISSSIFAGLNCSNCTYSPLAAVLFCIPYNIYPVNEFDFLFVTEKLGSKHLAAAKSMHLVHLSSLQSIYFFRERENLEMHSPFACKPHFRHFVGNIILEFGISLSTVFSSCRQLPLLWIITFCLGPHIRGSVILYRIGYHQRKIITCIHLVALYSIF